MTPSRQIATKREKRRETALLSLRRVGSSAPCVGSQSARLKVSLFTVGLGRFVALALLTVLFCAQASGATFTVINTNDSGGGSLRQAILDANAAIGADTIGFSIGSGPKTIRLLSALPPITDAVSIDGTTQPGSAGNPIIELDGTSAGTFASGLTIRSAGVTVRGFVINRFSTGIRIENPGGDVIRGNYIGSDMPGSTALPNSIGVNVLSGGNTIGGTILGDGNLVSGNTLYGVFISTPGTATNLIQGNFIGPASTGTTALGNGAGISVSAPNTTIGGTTPGARNVISGNFGSGIFASIVGTLTIQGNFIGLNAPGNAALGNGGNGVYVDQGTNIAVGGTAPGAGNMIAFNQQSGVATVGSRTSVQSNLIYANAGLGIDRGDNGVTLNVPCDSDGEQNFPVLTGASSSSGTTTIQGTLNSRPSQTYRVEFFTNTVCDPSGYGQGQVYLGSTTVTTNAACNGSFTVTLPVNLAPRSRLTATATGSVGNTSEFSRCTSLSARLHTLVPCRVADTRDEDGPYGGPSLDGGSARAYVIAGKCGIPTTAQAVAFNFTVTGATDPGFLRIFPGAPPVPLTSALNYQAGQVRGNNAILALGPSGDVIVLVDQAQGTVDLIIDVYGYFQ